MRNPMESKGEWRDEAAKKKQWIVLFGASSPFAQRVSGILRTPNLNESCDFWNRVFPTETYHQNNLQ